MHTQYIRIPIIALITGFSLIACQEGRRSSPATTVQEKAETQSAQQQQPPTPDADATRLEGSSIGGGSFRSTPGGQLLAQASSELIRELQLLNDATIPRWPEDFSTRRENGELKVVKGGRWTKQRFVELFKMPERNRPSSKGLRILDDKCAIRPANGTGSTIQDCSSLRANEQGGDLQLSLDYDPNEDRIIILSPFFERYNNEDVTTSDIQKRVAVQDIKRMLLHEAAHLLLVAPRTGKNGEIDSSQEDVLRGIGGANAADQEARNFANEILDLIRWNNISCKIPNSDWPDRVGRSDLGNAEFVYMIVNKPMGMGLQLSSFEVQESSEANPPRQGGTKSSITPVSGATDSQSANDEDSKGDRQSEGEIRESARETSAGVVRYAAIGRMARSFESATEKGAFSLANLMTESDFDSTPAVDEGEEAQSEAVAANQIIVAGFNLRTPTQDSNRFDWLVGSYDSNTIEYGFRDNSQTESSRNHFERTLILRRDGANGSKFKGQMRAKSGQTPEFDCIETFRTINQSVLQVSQPRQSEED